MVTWVRERKWTCLGCLGVFLLALLLVIGIYYAAPAVLARLNENKAAVANVPCAQGNPPDLPYGVTATWDQDQCRWKLTAQAQSPAQEEVPSTTTGTTEVTTVQSPEQNTSLTETSGISVTQEVVPGSYVVTGVFDKAEHVLLAECPDPYGNCFKNTIGLGSQSWLAEPGSILYGPDEPADIVKGNPHGDYFNPITQVMLVFPEADISVGEGGFILASAREMTVQIGDVSVRLEGSDQHIWILIVRGLFADETNVDRNVTAHFSGYVSGHAQVMRYPAGAFISEEQFLQIVDTGHTNTYSNSGGEAVAVSSRNCGDTGCDNASIMFIDLNTKAWTVLRHTEGGTFTWEASNWFKP